MSTLAQNGDEGFAARILHLEDSRLDAEIVGYFLQNGGVTAEITLASDVGTFQKALAEQTFDVILCDQNLPGWVGPKPFELARQSQPSVPVIVLSGNLDNLGTQQPTADGLAYVLKSELASLVAMVRQSMEKSRLAKRALDAQRPAA